MRHGALSLIERKRLYANDLNMNLDIEDGGDLAEELVPRKDLPCQHAIILEPIHSLNFRNPFSTIRDNS